MKKKITTVTPKNITISHPYPKSFITFLSRNIYDYFMTIKEELKYIPWYRFQIGDDESNQIHGQHGKFKVILKDL